MGGLTLGADPIANAVLHASVAAGTPVDAFVVRKEPKDHGRGRRIEGNFQAGDTVVVVDDVITTGGSTLKAIDAIEAEGGRVAAALVLLTASPDKARAAVIQCAFPLIAVVLLVIALL